MKKLEFPTIYIATGYDAIEDENGNKGFGVYDPLEKQIYIAGDVPNEVRLKSLFHELAHWVQDVSGMEFDEDEAEHFADYLYGVLLQIEEENDCMS